MKYRKKPIIIEAYQTDVELDIETLEGVMHASIGDYIITGVNGEKYPCKPDIFEKTYELVEENNYKNKISKALEALEELVVVLETNPGTKQYNDIFEIHLVKPIETVLKSLKTFEDKSGIDLLILFKAIENGFYYIKNDEIKFCRWCVRVGNYLVETKPCYAVKETTIQSCYYGDVSELKQMTDAHYWDWDSSLHVELKDYGKTWALTREELENE